MIGSIRNAFGSTSLLFNPRLNGNAIDESTNANNLTAVSMTYADTNGFLNNGGNFSGSGYVHKASPAGLNGGMAAAAFGFWFKTTNTGTLTEIMGLGGGASTSTYWAWARKTAANKLSMTIQRTAGDTILTSSTTVTDGKWHFAVSSYNGVNNNLILDGVEEATTGKTGTVLAVDLTNATQGSVAVGIMAGTSNSDFASYNKFTGSISDPFAYSRAITVAEVKSYLRSLKQTTVST